MHTPHDVRIDHVFDRYILTTKPAEDGQWGGLTNPEPVIASPAGTMFYALVEDGPNGTYVTVSTDMEVVISLLEDDIDMWEDDNGKMRPRFEQKVAQAIESFRQNPSAAPYVNSDGPDGSEDGWVGMDSTTLRLCTVYTAPIEQRAKEVLYA